MDASDRDVATRNTALESIPDWNPSDRQYGRRGTSSPKVSFLLFSPASISPERRKSSKSQPEGSMSGIGARRSVGEVAQ
jgi:hypothetical protein